jgi:uncharacterized protein (TIGR02231 family)
VTQVTLLEDRAQVRRVGALTLAAGQHTVLVQDVAPVLQDVSLRASASGSARVVDTRVRRALKVTRDERPEVVKALEADLERLSTVIERLSEDHAALVLRRQRLEQVLEKGFTELPQDVSWGVSAPQWKETLEGLFEKLRQAREKALEVEQALRERTDERQALIAQRQAFDRVDARFTAWLEADVVVTGKEPVEVTFEYTVPNALWRPLHSARLADGQLFFESRACVWQNTGEDWKGVRLVFSTARASLGIEPPLLSDDLLTAQKKSEKLVVQARQVVIQKAKAPGAGASSAAALPSTIELPGVDDGGELRTLEAKGPCTVPSDGRPNTVPLFDFVAPARTRLIGFPELELRVFLTSVQKNAAKAPILAGPVELLLQNGFVGWTKVGFVASGEDFQLSFGPDDSVRLARAEREKAVDSTIDGWKTMAQSVWLYVSNVGDTAKTVELTERMPVSELAQVKVELGAKRTTPKPGVDDNGFLTWKLELAPNSQQQVRFGYDVSTAPGVQGV